MSAPVYRLGVISDTHGFLNPRVFEIFEGVDMILHAGDIGRDDLLIELGAIAPVQAVSGNVDGIPEAPNRPLFRRIETPAGRIALTHGHLRTAMAANGPVLLHFFRDFQPRIIVFGHTHMPHHSQLEGVELFNPGSAGYARGGRRATVGLIHFELENSALTLEHIEL